MLSGTLEPGDDNYFAVVDKFLDAGGANFHDARVSIDTIGLNLIQTITENPNFLGTKTNTTVIDGNSLSLTLNQASGTYDFNSVVDLGATFTSYVESFIDIIQLNYALQFDSPVENFDVREGLFDGDPAAYDGSTAVVQIATTLDDPASPTATFTAFNNLSAGSYSAGHAREES